MSTADQQLAIGIDVGGTTIKGVLADTRGNIIATSEAVATPRTGAENVVAAAAQLARTLRENSPDAPVGVCVPGIINEEQGIGIFSANLGWKDAPLGDMLSQALDSFVPLGHDVRSGALAEALWGASASGIARRAIEAGLLPQGSGAREVEELALSHEDSSHLAQEILSTSMSLLGEVLATVCHQVGAIPLVLGGGLCRGGSLVYDPLRNALDKGCTVMPAPPVLTAALGSSSQALGAAALAFQSHGIEAES